MANFTKQAIKNSFMKLLNQKPLNKISVREIVEDCDINRNSFYYHFHDIPSLTEEIIMEETNRLIDKYPTLNSLHTFIDELDEVCTQNRTAILHIYNSVSREVYEKYMMHLCDEIVWKYAKTIQGVIPLDEKEDLVLHNGAKYMLFGFCQEWISGGLEKDYVQDLHIMCDLVYDLLSHIATEKRHNV